MLVGVLAGTLTGCTPAGTRSDAANVLGSIVEHLEAASSAVATATLAVELHEQGRLPAVTTDAAVDDATLTVSEAVHGITTVVAPDAGTAGLRTTAIGAASAALGPVADVRTWLADGAPEGDDLRTALDEAATDLEAATTAVEQAEAAQ